MSARESHSVWPRPISIWEPRRDPPEAGGEIAFVRPPPSPLGDHYATAPVLRQKRSELPLRVVLFGESVAAGYLYAPGLTPAGALAGHLEALRPGLCEVIDLARTNETLASLAATVEASIQIQPDLLVLFAGNNWNLLETPEISAQAPSVPGRVRFAAHLKEGGLAGPVEAAALALAERAHGALDRIAALTRAIGIPVVLVVPEVDLDTWENRQPVPWLPGDGAARWHELLARGRECLEAGDAAAAAGIAREMLALDGGLCPTGHRLLGRAEQVQGDLPAALAAFRAEVDAAAYPLLACLGAPQATSVARGILRAAAARHGWLPVDLPSLFAEVSGSPLPGRRFFLDYCHLTAEGIHVAMAAVAAAVLPFTGDSSAPNLQDLLARLPATHPAPEVEAVARLGAAIHGAHRQLILGDKTAGIEADLDAALDASPHAEAALLALVEARVAPLPAVATAAQRRNLDSPCPLKLQHGWRWDFLDADVLIAAERALGRRGSPGADEIRRLILTRAVGPEWTELACAPFLWEPLEQLYSDLLDFEDLARRAFLRCPWPEVGFTLIATGEEDLEIEAVVRRPFAAGRREPCTLALGGRPLGRIEAGGSWRRERLRVPSRFVRKGLERLSLAWPPPSIDGESALDLAISRLEAGVEADLHPVFGEIASLKVRAVPESASALTSRDRPPSPFR